VVGNAQPKRLAYAQAQRVSVQSDGPRSSWLRLDWSCGNKPVRTSTFFRIALLALAVLAAKEAEAGSAVAIGPHNQMAASCGYPKEIAEQRALELARHRYGPNVRLLAAIDVTGYGAIAVARHPNGNWVAGVSLGRPSAADAANQAIEQCRKVGGIDPKVRWRFRG